MIPFNKPVVLENIFYDFDSDLLREESKEEIDDLINILNDYPNITIELKSHTDRWGSEVYNHNLSLKRAHSVKEYLIEHGINKKRIIIVSVGKNEPKKVSTSLAIKYDFLNIDDVLTDETISMFTLEQQEIADQVNRRTEFRIIDF